MKEIKLSTEKFLKHWGQYLTLLLSISLLTELLVIPFFRLLTTFMLQAGRIPFISYQNIIILLTTHPFVCAGLLFELIGIILVIYGEFSYLLLGIEAINNEEFNFKKIMSQILRIFKKLKIGTLLYLILYFLLIIPFVDIIYRTPLLAKIHLPQFIADYMIRSKILVIILIIGYLLILYIGIRSIFILPLMINKSFSIKEAKKISWTWTSRKNGLKIIEQLFFIEVVSFLFTVVGYGIIIGLQVYWDLLPKKLSFVFAQFSLLLIQVIAFMAISYVFVVSVLILFDKLIGEKKYKKKIDFYYKKKYLLPLLLLVEFGLVFVNNNFYLNNVRVKDPIIISHRGVSEKNGVQNTVAALKKTARLKPEYVEIDLHETADKKLVVMHDENLKKLAGKNLVPHDLTLKQLQKITILENGYQEKIASFDEYLKEAQKLHQKLLIEIKTTPRDSSGLLNQFNKKYGKRIVKQKYQVQSLDYHVIEKLHQLNPQLFLIYIQPYNFTYPHSVADGYAMEYSTLNNDFIWQAHLQNKIVYAWTVNKPNIIKKMMYYHVNGIITDNVEVAKKTIKKFKQENTYTHQLLNYVLVFSY